MDLKGFTINLEPVLQLIKEKKIQRIALQLPEGLKNNALDIVSYIKQKASAEVFILADPCFGACDISTDELADMQVEILLHIGHSPLAKQPESPIPIEFIPAVATIDITPVMKKAAQQLTGKTVGLITTIQHLHMLELMQKILEKNGVKTIVGHPSNRSIHPGQILGCNFSAAVNITESVDVFLYVGSGMFHPLGIRLVSKKPVYSADPYSQKIQQKEIDILRETVLRQRYGAIALAKQSRRFGIIISAKKGQQRIYTALNMQHLLLQAHKEVYLFLMDQITPETIMKFRSIECFISTSCPRVAIDDYQQYKTPILTPVEAEIAFGVRTWDAYVFDEFLDTDEK
jgi:2-(3-amino-3-carboxypropyl)histidine synthase